jgi:sulfur carrier protein
MTVRLNGERRELEDAASVADAVAAAGADPEGRGIACAVDGDVVPRASWTDTRLREGQTIEVVQAIQGG